MCTVTLHRTGQQLLLTMNRDEARARGPELPPARHTADNGVSWIGPGDSDKGGTWFAANDRGIAACLLNRYQDSAPDLPAEPRSRGTIIPALMAADTVPEAQEVLASGAMRLEAFPPFTLVLASVTAAACLDWSGSGTLQESPVGEPWHLVTSSFYEPDVVLPWRRDKFDAWIAAGAAFHHGIPAFHLCQPAGKETMAPLMAREVSCTRSITQTLVDPSAGTCSLRYAPVADSIPDWSRFTTPEVLQLARNHER